MSKMLVETQATAVTTTTLEESDCDIFHEAETLRNFMGFLARSAKDAGLDETATALLAAAQAIDMDLRRHCN
jgi:hypothetical protein